MSRNKWWILALCALPVLAGCGGGSKEETASAPADTAAPAAAPANAGSISGTVTFAGQDTDTPIAMNADPVCASLHSTPVDTNEIAAKDGKLANVFVYVKSGLTGTFPAPAEKKELDQQGCQYTPRVQGIQVGQALVIKNTDATLHNVHALPTANQEFNQAQPNGLPPFEKTFDKVEVPPIHVKCDVHPWMTAYVGVVDNPFFATSGEDGTFSIKDLPPGKYTLEAWHEKLGTKTQEVTIAPNQTASVTFAF